MQVGNVGNVPPPGGSGPVYGPQGSGPIDEARTYAEDTAKKFLELSDLYAKYADAKDPATKTKLIAQINGKLNEINKNLDHLRSMQGDLPDNVRKTIDTLSELTNSLIEKPELPTQGFIARCAMTAGLLIGQLGG